MDVLQDVHAANQKPSRKLILRKQKVKQRFVISVVTYKNRSRPSRRASLHFANDWTNACNHSRARYLFRENIINQDQNENSSGKHMMQAAKKQKRTTFISVAALDAS